MANEDAGSAKKGQPAARLTDLMICFSTISGTIPYVHYELVVWYIHVHWYGAAVLTAAKKNLSWPLDS